MTNPLLKETVDITNGLFAQLTDPLWNDRYQPLDMDIEFLTRYGQRPVSPLLSYFIDPTTNTITTENLKKVADLIYRKYSEQWKRKYAVLDAEYGILDNYSMTESENISRESMEHTLREIARTNQETTEQINDLLEKLTNTQSGTLVKTGTDKTDSSTSNTQTNDLTVDSKLTGDDSNEQTLSFTDRKDTTSGTKSTGKNETITNNLTDELTTDNETTYNTHTGEDSTSILSFTNRKDSTSGSTKTNGTVGVNNTTDTTGHSQGETGSDQGVYGFNSDSSVPSNTTDGTTVNDTTGQEKLNGTTTTDMTVGVTSDLTKAGTETTTVSGTGSKTGTEGTSGTDTTTHQGTVQTTGTDTETDAMDLTKTGSEKTVTDTTKSEDTLTKTTGTVTDAATGTETLTHNTTDTSSADGESNKQNTGSVNTSVNGSNSENGEDTTNGTETENRDVTRTGNIGVTTSTQLLQEHINFWAYNFLNDVYSDVASMICLDIYRHEECVEEW